MKHASRCETLQQEDSSATEPKVSNRFHLQPSFKFSSCK